MLSKHFVLNLLLMTALFISAALQPVRGTEQNFDNRGGYIFAKDAMQETATLANVSEKLTCESKTVYFFDDFNDLEKSPKRWVQSQVKEDDKAKYDGVWKWEEPNIRWNNDIGLVLKSKAKHSAIAAPLDEPFTFGGDKSLVVQYEVLMQEGQDCGGAYIKLLSAGQETNDLTKFRDNTPYTIMFGPDKCGPDAKLHFIIRHVNPIDGSITEKHCRQPDVNLARYFVDKLPHLYQLVIRPDKSFEIRVDYLIVKKGSLFADFELWESPSCDADCPAVKESDDLAECDKDDNSEPFVNETAEIDGKIIIDLAEGEKKHPPIEDFGSQVNSPRDIDAPEASKSGTSAEGAKTSSILDDFQLSMNAQREADAPEDTGSVNLAEGEEESSFLEDFADIETPIAKKAVDLTEGAEAASQLENFDLSQVVKGDSQLDDTKPKRNRSPKIKAEIESPIDLTRIFKRLVYSTVSEKKAVLLEVGVLPVPLNLGTPIVKNTGGLPEDEKDGLQLDDIKPQDNLPSESGTLQNEESIDLTQVFKESVYSAEEKKVVLEVSVPPLPIDIVMPIVKLTGELTEGENADSQLDDMQPEIYPPLENDDFEIKESIDLTQVVKGSVNSDEAEKKFAFLEVSVPASPLAISSPIAKTAGDLTNEETGSQIEDIQPQDNPLRESHAFEFKRSVDIETPIVKTTGDLIKGEKAGSQLEDLPTLNPPRESSAFKINKSFDLTDVETEESESPINPPREVDVKTLTKNKNEALQLDDVELHKTVPLAIHKSADMVQVEEENASLKEFEPANNSPHEIAATSLEKPVELANSETISDTEINDGVLSQPSGPNIKTDDSDGELKAKQKQDVTPFELSPIFAVGIEVWSMSSNVLFDNFMITDDVTVANAYAAETFTPKHNYMRQHMSNAIDLLIRQPWHFAIGAFIISLAITLIIYNFLPDDKARDTVIPDNDALSSGGGDDDGDILEESPVPKQKKADLDVREDTLTDLCDANGASGDSVLENDGVNDDGLVSDALDDDGGDVNAVMGDEVDGDALVDQGVVNDAGDVDAVIGDAVDGDALVDQAVINDEGDVDEVIGDAVDGDALVYQGVVNATRDDDGWEDDDNDDDFIEANDNVAKVTDGSVVIEDGWAVETEEVPCKRIRLSEDCPMEPQ